MQNDQMSLEPIQQTDLSYKVYERIKEMILSGELEPGQKLPQEHIAEQLGVSRMPLHKAFVMLEDEFLVESIPRRGIFIKKPDLQEIIDAFEVREGLEGIAARRACRLLRESDLLQMEALFQNFRDDHSIDHAAYQSADSEFHEMIIRASGNKVMHRLNSIGSVLIRTYPKGIILPFEESMKDHDEIIAAFRKGDEHLAEKLVRMHSRKARNILQEKLNKEKETNEEKL